MNMNMKNEKTMLALVLVAALAMVSVAGVALASESDAIVVNTEKIVIEDGETITQDYNVEASDSGVYTVQIIGTYTGTLSFGTYVDDVFTPYVTLTLTGVSNAFIKYDAAHSDAVVIYVNNPEIKNSADNNTIYNDGVVSGDIKVSLGAIVLGTVDKYFTGSVAGNTTTIDALNVEGFILVAGTTDVICGDVTQGDMEKIVVATDGTYTYPVVGATINLTGTATLALDLDDNNKALTIGSDVTFTIAADSTVSGGENGVKYEVNAIDKKLTIDTPGMTGATAILMDSEGKTIGICKDATTSISFDLAAGFDLSETYTVLIAGYVYTAAGATAAASVVAYTYVGTLTFTVTADKVTPVLTQSSTVNKTEAFDLVVSGIDFDTSAYTAVYATAFTVDGPSQKSMVISTTSGSEGEFRFLNPEDTFAANDFIFLVVKDKTTGGYFAYVGHVMTVPTSTVTGVFSMNEGVTIFEAIADKNATDPVGSDPVKGQIMPSTDLVRSSTIDDVAETEQISTIEVEGILNVLGTLNLNYTSTKSYAALTIDATGEVTVSGYIYAEYDTSVTVTITTGGTMNAAYYDTKVSSTTTPKNLRTYTTISKALTESDKIFIIGAHDILEDLEFVSTLEGSTATEITIMNGAVVIIGNNDADALATAIVTVPTNSTVYINGIVIVENGQYRISGLTADRYGSSVEAAVFYVNTEYGIYTDLATALGLATTAGETVTLRANATLSTDATLAEGVILDAKTFDILVKAGTTFTVNGILKANNIFIEGAYGTGVTAKTAGELVLNSYDKDMKIASIQLGVSIAINGRAQGTYTYGGIVTFGSAFDVGTAGKVTANLVVVSSNEANPAIVNINGNVRYAGTVSGEGYITFNVVGTAIFTTIADAHDLIGTTNVTGTLTADGVTFATTYLNVTGSGIVSVENSGVVFVVKKFVSGTPTLDITETTNGTKAVVLLSDDTGYVATAIIYGSYDASDIVVYNATGTSDDLFTTVFYVNKNVVYKTQIGYASQVLDLTSLKLTAYNFLGWYDSASNGNKMKVTDLVKDYAEVFGYTEVKTTPITLSMVQNGSYIINGINYGSSGNVEIPYAESYILSVLADNGYELSSDFQILVNGHAMPANYTPVEGDVISFSGTINEKSAPAEGMDLVTILLIIITIVIIIMAIIIALKLMRS